MPAVIDALRQVLPPEAIGPLAQAFGNCAQPLAHRAGVNFVGPRKPNVNGTYGGNVYGGGSFGNGVAWNPSFYNNLYPGGDTYNAGDYHNNVDVGGMTVTWNEGNRYDSQFYFPTNQVFQQNQYYGGPTINVDGGARIDYITNQYFDGGDVNVHNVTTQVLNGDPAAGPAGAPGQQGKDGQRGAPGAPGGFFGVLPPGFFGPIRYLTGRPNLTFVPRDVATKHRYIKDAWVRSAVTVSVPTDAIAGGYIDLEPAPVQITVPVSYTFDPDLCTVSVSDTTTFWAFPSAPTSQTLSTVAASGVSVIAATTAASTRASVVAANGFVVKGADADFWERTPGFAQVAANPKLPNVTPANVRVYQQ
jgi:hypothetical protein